MRFLPGFASCSGPGSSGPRAVGLLARVLFATVVFTVGGSDLQAGSPPSPVAMTVSLAAASDSWKPGSGVTTNPQVQIVGKTAAGLKVGFDRRRDGHPVQVTQADSAGRFTMTLGVQLGANLLAFGPTDGKTVTDVASMSVVYWPVPFFRPFTGSPTAGLEPFTRLIPNSQAYAPGLPPRPSAMSLAQTMLEDPNHPAFSPNIVLGLVFFGQFVDHDMTSNLTSPGGQGMSSSPPIDVRTPALDLDSVYGDGPQDEPSFYDSDGLFFLLGAKGTDLLRNSQGVAIIGDARNDENGLIRIIHSAFQEMFDNMGDEHMSSTASIRPVSAPCRKARCSRWCATR